MKNLLDKVLLEAGYRLPDSVVTAFATTLLELKKWNKTVNLTAIRTDEDSIVKHLIDSLAVVNHLHDGEQILDLGSGAGFPSIPLKIMHPELTITSVDAVLKKITFQKHVARTLSLHDFYPLHCRVENMYAEFTEKFDVILSRAFSRLDLFAGLVSPLVKRNGRLLAMKGPGYETELEHGNEALRKLGFTVAAVYPYSLPRSKGDRCIVELKRHE